MRGYVTSSMRTGLPPGWTTADKALIAEATRSVLPWLTGQG
jgi:hypothetical protein